MKVVALLVFTHVHNKAVGAEIANGPLRHTTDVVGNKIARYRVDKHFILKLAIFIVGKGVFIHIVGGIDDAEAKSQAVGLTELEGMLGSAG